MGHIHEPLDVDFYVDPRPLTAEERSRISEYIKKDKEERNEPGHGGAQQKLAGRRPADRRPKASGPKMLKRSAKANNQFNGKQKNTAPSTRQLLARSLGAIRIGYTNH